jgi:hypothetical protein
MLDAMPPSACLPRVQQTTHMPYFALPADQIKQSLRTTQPHTLRCLPTLSPDTGVCHPPPKTYPRKAHHTNKPTQAAH